MSRVLPRNTSDRGSSVGCTCYDYLSVAGTDDLLTEYVVTRWYQQQTIRSLLRIISYISYATHSFTPLPHHTAPLFFINMYRAHYPIPYSNCFLHEYSFTASFLLNIYLPPPPHPPPHHHIPSSSSSSSSYILLLLLLLILLLLII